MSEGQEVDHRVRYDVAGHVARLTVDVPDRLNAFDGEVAGMVLRHLVAAADDDAVRVLVLRGAGGNFSAGGDLRSMAAARREAASARPAEHVAPDARDLLTIAEVLASMPAVTIAAVRGVCAGGALGWACACDLRIASTTARFVPAFAAVGQTGDYGITWTLPRIVGEGRARDMLLVGDQIGAVEAERIGLASRVYDDHGFDTRVDEIAELLAGRAPLALRGIKRNLDLAGRASLADALDTEAATMAENSATADAAEAMAAFVEKRPPVFTGR